MATSRQGACRNAAATTIPRSQQQVLLAGDSQGPHRQPVLPAILDALARVRLPVPGVVDREQDGDREEPGHGESQRPDEGHSGQVAQEEGRIAERRQAAPDVRDQEDEEDHGVGDVLPLAIRLEERADEQHRGPGGADEGGEERPSGQEGGVRPRRGLEITVEEDAARDHVEAREQDDEGHVVEGGVDEGLGVVREVEPEHGQAEHRAKAQLPKVRLPEVRGEEGQDRDGQEQEREGSDPDHGGDERSAFHGSRSVTSPVRPR